LRLICKLLVALCYQLTTIIMFALLASFSLHVTYAPLASIRCGVVMQQAAYNKCTTCLYNKSQVWAYSSRIRLLRWLCCYCYLLIWHWFRNELQFTVIDVQGTGYSC